MTTLNRPDKLTLDAFSDGQLEITNVGGVYNRFTNQLRTPILNAKGIQLLNMNFVNSMLQLNDNSQLMFFYYVNAAQNNIATLSNLRCVRLHPSTFVPYAGFTAYTKNQYFTTVADLIAQLNVAAATGGDSITYNPLWDADQVTFSYDANARKISVESTTADYIVPAAADDPNVLDTLRGTTTPGNRIRMNAYNSSNSYATATLQPYVEGVSMNARLGFSLGYNSRGLWWGALSQVGNASSTGVPQANGTPIEADTNPILLGSQNLSVYLSIVTGSGIDSSGRKNLIAIIPIEAAPLGVNSYTLSSVEKPAISVPTEIYEVSVEMLDDYGQPFVQPFSYNTTLSLSVYY